MYTLRTIYKAKDGWLEPGVENNLKLGHSYTTIRQDRSPALFKEELERGGWTQSEKIYAIVRDPEGVVTPLWDWADYFVMTESGKTFERI